MILSLHQCIVIHTIFNLKHEKKFKKEGLISLSKFMMAFESLNSFYDENRMSGTNSSLCSPVIKWECS